MNNHLIKILEDVYLKDALAEFPNQWISALYLSIYAMPLRLIYNEVDIAVSLSTVLYEGVAMGDLACIESKGGFYYRDIRGSWN